MVDLTLLAVFIPTFFIVSVTPGMCMTLAMTLGMTIGVKRTLWMMLGEVIGVAIVAVAAVIGVAALMLKFPALFTVLKFVGAGYLAWIAVQMWRSKGKMAISDNPDNAVIHSNVGLFNQGLVTALANPKGWAFQVSLLPPFINPDLALPAQLTVLVLIIMCSEFVCMMMYATGGKTIGRVLTKSQNVQRLNKISGSLMMMVAVWLALGN
ncbi:LysE family translocator [Psychrosphaera aestuarii]|uniref:LysE family translocator n=1 Tax=Psychrosphaera aestuarii TaxID=1266052 RepID=UPI001B318E2F|nr:LysE family translocator [Psychrosphaera aestuarii]